MEILSLDGAFKNPSKFYINFLMILKPILQVFIVQDMAHNMVLYIEQIQDYLRVEKRVRKKEEE